MNGNTVKTIEASVQAGCVHISPISAWELGWATAAGTLSIAMPPLDYFNAFVRTSGAALCGLEPDVLVASSYLPGKIHKDPMDRILIETARRNRLTLVTRDRAILSYGGDGHVKVMAC